MVAFSIFGFSVYWYGIFYAMAFLLGYCVLNWLGQKKLFAQDSKIQYFLTKGIDDLLMLIVLGVLIWGRLGHVLIYGEGYYFEHWQEIFQVWKWGMSFIWGIFGVVITLSSYRWIKKGKKSDFFLLFDCLLLVVPFGILIGRFGNFLNQELYGLPVQDLPTLRTQLFQSLGLVHIYPKIDQALRVNTNFLSMIFEGGVLLGIQIFTFWKMLQNKRRKVWLLATHFLLGYSLIRFVLEFLRADSQLEIIAGLSKSQRFFLVFILIALALKRRLRKEKALELC